MPGWPERVKTMQRNWIGRSTGTQFSFTVEGMDEQIPVYTTRVDTVYGVTYMVLAPEHPLVPKLIESNPDKASLETFIERMRNENDIVRTAEDAPKEGMFTGSYAIHPLTGERILIWIANYVLMNTAQALSWLYRRATRETGNSLKVQSSGQAGYPEQGT